MAQKMVAHPREKAQSMVELAFSIMFMLLLVAGVVDLGRAFFAYITLRDAAQEGAAYASIVRDDPADPIDSAVCDQIRSRIRNSATNTPVNLQNATVDIIFGGIDCNVPPSPSNACFGQDVKIIVSSNFSLATPFLGTIIGSQTIPIQASIVDMVLTPYCE